MKKIFDLRKYRIDRNAYSFKSKNVLLHDEDNQLRRYSCLILVEKSSGEIISYTGLERYVIDWGKDIVSESTYLYTESRVKDFLNYILHQL